MHSVSSFRYVLANSFCAYLGFRAFILVGFLLLILVVIFTSARFFLSVKFSLWTIGLALCLVDIYIYIYIYIYLGSSWLIRGHPFREREDASLHPSVYGISIIDCVAESEQYVVELSGLLYFWGNIVKPCGFPIFNFF